MIEQIVERIATARRPLYEDRVPVGRILLADPWFTVLAQHVLPDVMPGLDGYSWEGVEVVRSLRSAVVSDPSFGFREVAIEGLPEVSSH